MTAKPNNGYRVPLVLSGIPLLPGESPEPLSVDGTASEVKGGVAEVCVCVCVCLRSSWFSSLLLTAESNPQAHQRASILMHVCLFSLEILRILQRNPQLSLVTIFILIS